MSVCVCVCVCACMCVLSKCMWVGACVCVCVCVFKNIVKKGFQNNVPAFRLIFCKNCEKHFFCVCSTLL